MARNAKSTTRPTFFLSEAMLDVKIRFKYQIISYNQSINLQQEEGHYEPGDEINAESTRKFSGICECTKNTAPWNENSGIGHPECAIGCES